MNCDKNDLLLYAVTDRHWLDGRRLIDVVRESLDGGVTMVQLREKTLEEGKFLEEAKELQTLCRERGVPIYASGNIFKLSMASLRGDEVRMLRRGDDGTVPIAPQGLPEGAPLAVENTIFDETPAHLFAGLITDQGVLPPPAIAEFRNHPMLAAGA